MRAIDGVENMEAEEAGIRPMQPAGLPATGNIDQTIGVGK